LIGATGTCETVTGTAALARPTVTLMVAFPFATAVTVGVALPLTVATVGADDVTLGTAFGIAAPFWSRTVTEKDAVAPTASNERLETDAVSVVATSGGVESLPHAMPALARTSAATHTTRRAERRVPARRGDACGRDGRFMQGAKVG
jgi:hypothetical protein